MPRPLDALGALCTQHRLALVEDCAHAHGSQWHGQPVGSFGDAGTFSFQQSKLLTAGEGGAITVREDAPAHPDSLQHLAAALDQFARDRDWLQFHSPKNLASALVVEAGELLEHFMWMPEAESRTLTPEKREAVGAEVADVLLYLVQLARALDIDPIAAARAKMQRNAVRYPADRARGNSRKYDEL